MTTFQQANDERDAASELIASYGGVVLQVTPRHEHGDWILEVETAYAMSNKLKDQLQLHGVRIILTDRGVVPREQRPGYFRLASKPAPQ